MRRDRRGVDWRKVLAAVVVLYALLYLAAGVVYVNWADDAHQPSGVTEVVG